MISTVTEITGRAWVRQADGALSELRPGAVVALQSEVVTAAGAAVTLAIDGTAPITIGENRRVAITDALIAPVDPSEAVFAPSTMADLNRLLAAFDFGKALDPIMCAENPAALSSSAVNGRARGRDTVFA